MQQQYRSFTQRNIFEKVLFVCLFVCLFSLRKEGKGENAFCDMPIRIAQHTFNIVITSLALFYSCIIIQRYSIKLSRAMYTNLAAAVRSLSSILYFVAGFRPAQAHTPQVNDLTCLLMWYAALLPPTGDNKKIK